MIEKSSSIKQIQDYCIQLLSFFDAYAKENNITYYMAGGTLLGAVRHHGFIPWDDDVDLMLPREDYERLISSFSNDRYCLSCCENDTDYNNPFARIWDVKTNLKWHMIQDKELGVFIDLFPMDGFPGNNIRTYLHLFHIKIIRVFLNTSIRTNFRNNEKYKSLKKILKIFVKKNGNYYSRRLNVIAQKFKYSNSQFVGVKTTSDHLFREKNSKHIFDKTILLPFENLMLPAPAGYDIYLKHLYGEYMKLPSEEKRRSEHYFTIEINE